LIESECARVSTTATRAGTEPVASFELGARCAAFVAGVVLFAVVAAGVIGVPPAGVCVRRGDAAGVMGVPPGGVCARCGGALAAAVMGVPPGGVCARCGDVPAGVIGVPPGGVCVRLGGVFAPGAVGARFGGLRGADADADAAAGDVDVGDVGVGGGAAARPAEPAEASDVDPAETGGGGDITNVSSLRDGVFDSILSGDSGVEGTRGGRTSPVRISAAGSAGLAAGFGLLKRTDGVLSAACDRSPGDCGPGHAHIDELCPSSADATGAELGAVVDDPLGVAAACSSTSCAAFIADAASSSSSSGGLPS
jgi:hypothetical protein